MQKPNKVLILGSGALRIGQAGEFDYSGSQAIKALKEENIQTVLINPNIASVQTDVGMADKIYFLPIEVSFIDQVIQQEKPDAILLSFGGQTALNCGLALYDLGILQKYAIKVLGTPLASIKNTEDRELFKLKLAEIDVSFAKSIIAYSEEEAMQAATKIGYPVMIRSGFSLGGKGSAIIRNEHEASKIINHAFANNQQLLIEECLSGWKEIEYEVVRDHSDQCITVCNMENIDPMGIHTGESIVVAPSQTLSNEDYQLLRNIAINTIRHLGIVGECNIQFALDPHSNQYRVIEVNARLSRSSALASKATGYPLAYVAAKIALGYRLDQIKNGLVNVNSAYYEPALDYIVCKIPRWDLQKFPKVNPVIGTEMKSVGEVMAIGRTFQEALQKALRMIELGWDGLSTDSLHFEDLENAVKTPSPQRLFALAQALANGYSLEQIHQLSQIDKYFLAEIQQIVSLEKQIQALTFTDINYDLLKQAKCYGFSDNALSKLLKCSELDIRTLRHQLQIKPYLTQIDTCAAEYPANSKYQYLSYSRIKHDWPTTQGKKILILGSGCYRIGSSVEFDWCAINAAKTARDLGYEVIMLNNNPETVSTDYDFSDNLIFDEISVEVITEIFHIEKPFGVVISMSGQTPNSLAVKLAQNGINILGTSVDAINRAENRELFSELCDSLNITQPAWCKAENHETLVTNIDKIGGFPVLIRPSYVLSGSAMKVAYNFQQLQRYLQQATIVSKEHPVVISKFINHALEVEFDAVAVNGKIILHNVLEHIENAGVHSGDATLLLPPTSLDKDILNSILETSQKLATALKITGPFNLQLLIKNQTIMVIECNLRASRSFPFISKALGVNFIDLATRVILQKQHDYAAITIQPSPFYSIKAAQFSFDRLQQADPKLGVEMLSTGEVACFGMNKAQALLHAAIAAGVRTPIHRVLLIMENISHEFLENIRKVSPTEFDLALYTENTNTKTSSVKFLSFYEIKNLIIHKQFDLVIDCNTVDEETNENCYQLRRSAIDNGIPVLLNQKLGFEVLLAYHENVQINTIKSYDQYQQLNVNH